MTERLEGAHRPGHFRGVATVVTKLFHIFAPTRAYFGQKDAQQVRVIQKMVADLDVDLEVVVVPTVREPDGLAMSSRNVYLDPAERRAAGVLWKVLRLAEERYHAGARDAAETRREMERILAAEPLARIEYVSIADAATLTELTVIDRAALVSLGGARRQDASHRQCRSPGINGAVVRSPCSDVRADGRFEAVTPRAWLTDASFGSTSPRCTCTSQRGFVCIRRLGQARQAAPLLLIHGGRDPPSEWDWGRAEPS